MRRSILLTYLVGFALIVAVIVTASVGAYTLIRKDLTLNSLRSIIQSASMMLPSEADYRGWADRIAEQDGEMRVTLIGADASVLADTASDLTDGENPAQLEEVEEAMQSEWGEAIRQDGQAGTLTLFVARRVDENTILRVGYPLPSSYRVLTLIWIAAGALAVLAVAAIVLLSNRLKKKLMRPIARIDDLLNDRIPNIDASGLYPEALPLINNIGARIAKLNSDMNEIQRTQRMRTDFVENASHELKTPLTSIKGYTELIAMDCVADDAQRAEYLQRIVNETNRLLAIIEDILHLSMAERGPAQQVQDVDLRAVTAEAIQALEPLAGKKHILLEMAGSATVRANTQEMWELIYNLIDNSIRYGREGGFVRICIDRLSVTVMDDGIGIPSDQLPRIFERFYRVDKAHGRSPVDGTGLGLSIVRHIAQKYGGNVEARSELGVGSTFTVTLW